MSEKKIDFKYLGAFIDGRFETPKQVSGQWVDTSPADFTDDIAQIQYSYASVDQAVESASSAFKTWKKTPMAVRAEYLRKYQSAITARKDEIVQAIAREVGKPLWEAKTEVAAMIAKVDITLNEGLRFVTPIEISKLNPGVDGACRYKPLGVMAVVGPFNFPGHLPNGHIVPALATGNTVVFKPSEKTPIVGQLMAECFAAAELPAGVFNLVQGEKETGRRLVVHEGVAAVLFTGSYEVGTRIKQDTLQQHWKLLALEMGGKNAAIVWEDEVVESTLLEVVTGAFLTTGQRCSATSRVIIRKKILEEFVERLHAQAKAFSIGHPFSDPFMGSLIDKSSMDRYSKFLGIAQREGCEIVMRGKALDLEVKGNYVSPSICLIQDVSIENTRKSIYQQTELFAPNVAILAVDDLDEAIAQANCTQYGLAASVFTSDRSVFEKCWNDLDMGLINWNTSTVGASSKLPFGGLKKSGNHFPTALTAVNYCTTPVASLEVAQPTHDPKSPGLNWVQKPLAKP